MEVRVLGPVEAARNGDLLALGGPKQRTVLALLVAADGRPVSVDALIDGVWGPEAGPGAKGTLQTYVSNLRSVLGGMVVREGDAYRLDLDRGLVDAWRFEDEVVAGRELIARRPLDGARKLRDALGLWRGRPFADVLGSSALDVDARRLEELRLSAVEDRIDAELELGSHAELVGELEVLTAEHPLRERLRGQHMLALYRSGRQAEALRVYDRTRELLVDELGIDPSPPLQELQQRVLRQDPELDLASEPRLETITVLFAGLDVPDVWPAEPSEVQRAFEVAEQRLVDEIVAGGGRLIRRGEPGVCAVFADVGAAAVVADGALRSLVADPTLSGDGQLPVAVAIDVGEVERRGGEYVGPPLTRGSRLVAVAHGGQVLLSGNAHQALSSTAAGWRAQALGEHQLVGLDGPAAVFQLLVEGLPASFPALRTDRPGLVLPGAVFERNARGYELRERVGGGDLGVVYRAYQPSVGREVAVKAVRGEFVNLAAFVQRFEVEAQVIARLEHPRVVPLYDFWRDPDGAYLVMRWMSGGSLRDALRRGPFHPDAAARLVGQVGAALSHAHRLGVVHRNLKPANVLLDVDGDAYVSDFSVAPRMVDASDGRRPVTDAPAYLAPEELRGETLTARADVYAFGMLLFELLAGRPPPMDGPLPNLHELRPELPAGLDTVIAKATTPDPADRFATVHEFVEATVGLLDDGQGLIEEVYTPTRNPYKGLYPFGQQDATDFHGRDSLVAELVQAVAKQRLVAVLGPSGIGKSSLVRAGLIPMLRAGVLPGSRSWLVTDLLPGGYPFEELEAALLRVAVERPAGLTEDLVADERGVVRAVKRLLPADTELLLVVDQFEELFTLTRDPAVRQRFLDALVALADDARARTRIVITLRADHLDGPLHHAEFGQLVRAGLVTVSQPAREQLTAMVREPARAVGVDFEDGLIERIVTDVVDQPGGLPLLQHALTELFAARTSDLLTMHGYGATGGVVGALSHRAEATYQQLDSPARAAARQVLLRLVIVDEQGRTTRRRVRRHELRALDIPPEVLDDVLDSFGAHRLLAFDRDPLTRSPTVEVAHEAILEAWPRLADWIAERREDLLVHRRLADAAAEWDDAGRDPAYLATGGRLVHFEVWAADTDLLRTKAERDYLLASREQDDQRAAAVRRRRRIIVAILTAAAIVAGVLAVVALLQRARADEQREIAAARELAASAIAVLDQDPELSVLLALEAARIDDPPPEAVSALHRAVQSSRAVFTARLDDTSPPVFYPGAAISPDGRHLALSGTGRYVDLFEIPEPGAPTEAPVRFGELRPQERNPAPVAVGFSPDGRTVAAMDHDAVIHLWDIADGNETTIEAPGYGPAVGMTFSPDGRRLAATSWTVPDPDPARSDAGMHVTVWALHSGDELGRWNFTMANGVTFHPDGNRLVVGDFGARKAVILDIESGQRRSSVLDDAPIQEAVFSPDGTMLATAGVDGNVDLWDVTSQERLATVRVAPDFLHHLAFSPDGTLLAAGGSGGELTVVDVQMGRPHMTLPGHEGIVGPASFSADGTRLASAASDRTARVWALEPSDTAEIAGWSLTGTVTDVDLRADTLAVALEDPCPFCSPSTHVIDLGTGEANEIPAAGWAVAIGRDARTVTAQTTAAEAGPLTTYDLRTRGPVTRLEATACDVPELEDLCADDGEPVYAVATDVAFGPDGDIAVVAGTEIEPGTRTISTWDTASRRLIAAVPVTDARALAISPDAQLVASGTIDRIAIRRTSDLTELADIPVTDPYDMAFSPDGELLAIATATDQPVLVDTASWQTIRQLPVSGARHLTFDLDGDRLLTTHEEGAVRIWNPHTGQELHRAPVVTDAPLLFAGFMTDQRRVVTVAEDGTVNVITVDTDELIELAGTKATRDLTDGECQRYLHTDGCP